MANEDFPIIPPGGGGGAPLGPGASIANTLQGILAQRRAEAQQSLINQLTQQKQNAEISHWQNEDAYNKDAREALAEQRHFTVEDRKAKQTQLLNNSGYDWDHAYDSDDPVIQDAMISKAQHPEKAESLDAIILNRRLALEAQKEKEQYEPEMWMDDVTKKSGYVLGADGKQHLVKKGTATHHIPRAAETAPATKAPVLKQEGVDPKGNNVFSLAGNVDPTTHLPLLYTSDPNGAGLVQYTGPVVRPKGAGSQPNFVIPPALEHELRTYTTGGVLGKRNVTSAFTHPGSMWGTNAGNPESLKAWKATAIGAINNFKSQLPPHVTQTAADIINKAEKFEDLSSDEIAKNSNLPDEDKVLLANVLAKVRMK